MKLAIIIIGDEILLGRVTDTNSGLIARKFSEIGWEVAGVRTVGDKADDIRSAINDSLASADLVITTGGLGPTRDDITKGVMAEIFGGSMIEDPAVTANVERIFAMRGLELNKLTRSQAWVPSSCRVIMNRLGTAPLMWFERSGKVLVAMPGVPFETRGMIDEVRRHVGEHFGNAGHIMHREFTVTGISESSLAESLAAFEDTLPAGFKLAYLPSPGEILLRLDGAPGADDEIFEHHAAALQTALGAHLAGTGKMTPAEIALHRLRAKGYTLATAESCTGGNIAHRLTSIPGSSESFLGGVVSYANEVKSGVLGVNPADIEAHGAVSREVVEQMAVGACRATGARCSMATSGIAGPGGGSDDKPVGTVWMAWAVDGHVESRVFHFPGNRSRVIDRATTEALLGLLAMIK